MLVIVIFGVVVIFYVFFLLVLKFDLKICWNFFLIYIELLCDIGIGFLFVVICVWLGFYLVGSIVIFVVLNYKMILDIDYF